MAELLPSELPLIIKKELIKAEDRINKTRTPNVDQDVVGGMPTDKPDSTSIGETILDILCSLRFLSENKIAVQKIVDAISESPDSTKVASEVLASVIDKKAVKAQNTANTAVTNAKTADDKAVKAQNTANTAVTNAGTAQNRADSAYALAEKKRDQNDLEFNGKMVISMSSGSYDRPFDYYRFGQRRFALQVSDSALALVYTNSIDKDESHLFPNKSGTVALISDAAAISAGQWSGWTGPLERSRAYGMANSLVPANCIFGHAEDKSSGTLYQARVFYYRIIRTGN